MLSDNMMSDSSDAPFAHQLKKGHSRLRFDEPLESSFINQYIANNQLKLRWAVSVSALLFIFFGIVDAYLLPPEVVKWGSSIRALVIAVLAINLLATFRPAMQSAIHLITLATCILVGIAVILIIYIAQYYGADIPFTGMLLIVFVFYFLSGLPFRFCLVAGASALAVYILLGILFSSPSSDIIYNSSFMIASNLIGCVGCYSYEHSARTNFLVNSLLNDVAERDGLTGLYNRRALDSHLDNLWRQSKRLQTPVAIAMIDVDHFKEYNDQFGHQKGDLALQKVAEVLTKYSQRSTDLVARYGGEEFIGVWSDISAEDAQSLIEKIRLEIEQNLAIPQAKSTQYDIVTISVGLSYVIPNVGQNLQEQINKADKALYTAKKNGRNRVEVVQS